MGARYRFSGEALLRREGQRFGSSFPGCLRRALNAAKQRFIERDLKAHFLRAGV